MKTICDHCEKVLSENGLQIENAIFTSELPCRKMTKETVYAHCEPCYETLLRGKNEQTNT